MPTLAQFTIGLGLDASAFNQGLSQAASQVDQLSSRIHQSAGSLGSVASQIEQPFNAASQAATKQGKAVDEAAASINRYGESAGHAASKSESFGSALRDTATEAGKLALGLAGYRGIETVFDTLSESAIGFNAHLQQSQVAWTTFLGSASAADTMITNLKQFSAQTPFRFQGLEDDARLLDAMGVSAKKVMPLLTDIGNAVSATGRGAEGMQRVAYTMGEIQSLGQVDDRTLRQLTIDGGIPAFEMLAQAMGKSTQEIRKMASQGKISADQFMTIFHNFVSQHWGDMMAKQALTFNGALSTVRDNLQMSIATAAEPLFNRLAADMANAAKNSMGFADTAASVASSLERVLSVLDKIDPRVVLVVAGFLAANLAVRAVVPALLDGAQAAMSLGSELLNAARAVAGLEPLRARTAEVSATEKDAAASAVAEGEALQALALAANEASAALERLTITQSSLTLGQELGTASTIENTMAGTASRGAGALGPDLWAKTPNLWAARTASQTAMRETASAAEDVAPALESLAAEETAAGAAAAGAETGVMGLGAAITLLGGPIGVIALAVAGFTVAYETNFLHTKDVTDQVTAKVVDDARIWSDALGHIGQATARIQLPNVGQMLGIETQLQGAQVLGNAINQATGSPHGVNLLTGTSGSILQLTPLAPLIPALQAAQQATDNYAQSEQKVNQNTDYFRDTTENATSVAEKHANAVARMAAAEDQAAASTYNWAEAMSKVPKALGGTSTAVNYLVKTNPAALQAAEGVATLEDKLKGLKEAQQANTEATRAAQESLKGMQEHVTSLNDALSIAKRHFSDLQHAQLIGMGAADDRIFSAQQAINRNELAQLELEAGANGRRPTGAERLRLRQLTREQQTLQRNARIAELKKTVEFDPELRQLQQAAKGPTQEMNFQDALKGIADTRTEIKNLEGQLITAKEAVLAQQEAINGLQAAGQALNQQISDTQNALQDQKQKQQEVNRALQDAYNWYLKDKEQLELLGPAGVQAANQIDGAISGMLSGLNTAMTEDTATAVKDIQGWIDALDAAKAKLSIAASGNTGFLNPGRRGDEGRALTPHASGGMAYAGQGYLVGERGPEPFFPTQDGMILPHGLLDSMAGTGGTSVQIVFADGSFRISGGDGALGQRLMAAMGGLKDYTRVLVESELTAGVGAPNSLVGAKR